MTTIKNSQPNEEERKLNEPPNEFPEEVEYYFFPDKQEEKEIDLEEWKSYLEDWYWAEAREKNIALNKRIKYVNKKVEEDINLLKQLAAKKHE